MTHQTPHAAMRTRRVNVSAVGSLVLALAAAGVWMALPLLGCTLAISAVVLSLRARRELIEAPGEPGARVAAAGFLVAAAVLVVGALPTVGSLLIGLSTAA